MVRDGQVGQKDQVFLLQHDPEETAWRRYSGLNFDRRTPRRGSSPGVAKLRVCLGVTHFGCVCAMEEQSMAVAPSPVSYTQWAVVGLQAMWGLLNRIYKCTF